jgi:predicted GNAT family acetyltransferase
MELTSFNSIEDFYKRAAPFLLEREAEHNLILGICTVLTRNPERIEQQPYLATVEHEGRVIAVALMTPPNRMVISYTTVGEAIPLIASDAYAKYDTLPGVVGSTPFAEHFAQEWQRLTAQPYNLTMAERIYQLEQVNPVSGVPGHLRRATEQDRQLLFRWLAEFNEEALGETDTSRVDQLIDRALRFETQGIYIWGDGSPVSMAGYSRPTPNGICVMAVYTPPPLRGKGYASACVAQLSQLLLDEGRKYCFLYTDLANPTSNHIYQAIGYQPICDAAMYRFADPKQQN